MVHLKNFKVKLIIAFLVPILFIANFANAETNSITYTTENYTEDNSVIANTEENVDESDVSSINSNMKSEDLYLKDDTVNIDNVVSGNVYIIANNVTINNVVDGNIFILANNVTITDKSYVYSDVFICAKTITINGYVYDLYSASNSLEIGESGYIIRDLHSGCNNFTSYGTIRRNAYIDADSINFDSSAKINGNLIYSSDKISGIDNNIVSGTVTYNQSNNDNKLAAFTTFSYVYNLISTLVYSLVIILIIILAMNKFAEKEKYIIFKRFWPAMGYGALGLIVIPLVSILLCFTVIGVWAALALLALFIFALTITTPIVAIALGKVIANKMNSNTKPMIIFISMLMVLAIWLLKNIPFVGIVVSLFKVILGLGIILYSIFKHKISEQTIEVK